MREAIDQSLDLVSELSSSPSDLEDDLDFDLQDSHRSRSRSRSRSSSRSRFSSPIDVVDLQNNAERQRGRGLQRGVGRGRGHFLPQNYKTNKKIIFFQFFFFIIIDNTFLYKHTKFQSPTVKNKPVIKKNSTPYLAPAQGVINRKQRRG